MQRLANLLKAPAIVTGNAASLCESGVFQEFGWIAGGFSPLPAGPGVNGGLARAAYFTAPGECDTSWYSGNGERREIGWL